MKIIISILVCCLSIAVSQAQTLQPVIPFGMTVMQNATTVRSSFNSITITIRYSDDNSVVWTSGSLTSAQVNFNHGDIRYDLGPFSGDFQRKMYIRTDVDGTIKDFPLPIVPYAIYALSSRSYAGSVTIGDVANGTSTTSSGYITSASKSNPSSTESLITIQFPDLGTTNYSPIISISSLGTSSDDNEIKVPLIKNVTSSSFDVYFEETTGVVQNLRINVVLSKY
ncbi:MAG: hypothetical protein U0264_00800 [Candidatus Kapaibacterium sp.]